MESGWFDAHTKAVVTRSKREVRLWSVQSFQRLVRVRLLQGTLHYCYMSEVSATAPEDQCLYWPFSRTIS